MTNVIAFRRPAERHIHDRPRVGATLFLHIKQTSMIVHLAKPQGERAVQTKKSSRS